MSESQPRARPGGHRARPVVVGQPEAVRPPAPTTTWWPTRRRRAASRSGAGGSARRSGRPSARSPSAARWTARPAVLGEHVADEHRRYCALMTVSTTTRPALTATTAQARRFTASAPRRGDGHRRGRRPTGTSATTVVPCPGRETSRTEPPTASRRSRMLDSPAPPPAASAPAASKPVPSSVDREPPAAARALAGDGEPHGHRGGRGVLGGVLHRLHREEVQRRLDAGREPSGAVGLDGDRHRAGRDRAAQRRHQALVGQQPGVDAAGQLGQRLDRLAGRDRLVGEDPGGALRGAGRHRLGQPQVDRERDQVLLGPVVDVPLEPAPLGVLGLDQALPRGPQLGGAGDQVVVAGGELGAQADQPRAPGPAWAARPEKSRSSTVVSGWSGRSCRRKTPSTCPPWRTGSARRRSPVASRAPSTGSGGSAASRRPRRPAARWRRGSAGPAR